MYPLFPDGLPAKERVVQIVFVKVYKQSSAWKILQNPDRQIQVVIRAGSSTLTTLWTAAIPTLHRESGSDSLQSFQLARSPSVWWARRCSVNLEWPQNWWSHLHERRDESCDDFTILQICVHAIDLPTLFVWKRKVEWQIFNPRPVPRQLILIQKQLLSADGPNRTHEAFCNLAQAAA